MRSRLGTYLVHYDHSAADVQPRGGDFLSNADEVHRPINEDSRITTRRGPVEPSAAKVLPKGRNFQ